jgi:ATP-dependent DNA helicase RecG
MRSRLAEEDPLARLRGPLELELRDGCRDRAVAGMSLGDYAGRWCQEMTGRLAPDRLRPIFEIVRVLRGYGRLSGPERKAAAERALAVLSRLHSERAPTSTRTQLPDLKTGVSPRRRTTGQDRLAQTLEKLGLRRREDLLHYFPRDYVEVKKIAQLEEGDRAAVVGQAGQREMNRLRPRGGRSFTKYALELEDDTGRATVTSFVQSAGGGWSPLKLLHKPGTRLLVEGSAKRWGNLIEIQHLNSQPLTRQFAPGPGELLPVYPLVDGVYQGQLRAASRSLLARGGKGPPDPLPEEVRREHRLIPLARALADIHWPPGRREQQEARRRLVFDEFFLLQLALAARKGEAAAAPPQLPAAAAGTVIAELEQRLGFRLTGAQRRAIAEIAEDLATPGRMNRLLQGDVGSGKTLVAAAAMLLAGRAGFQAALMAPTEILAEQHYLCLRDLLASQGLGLELLTASQPAPHRKRALENLRTGASQVAIGTQALIQEKVAFRRLALAIIDEQHRFGVLERSRLQQKGDAPATLVMTATPIPRTLTLTLYGDLELSLLDELPPGRRPVATEWLSTRELARAYGWLRGELAAGRQGYVVCPLVEESEQLQAQAAESLARELSEKILPEFSVGLIHGRLKLPEREQVMAAFRRGELHVLAATPVIEVGLDVPNATTIIVLSAERFGLSQLHQLRGRIARGRHPGRCFLVTEEGYRPGASGGEEEPEAAALARRRLQILLETNDGFQIAEGDLRLRGPGEMLGTRQHGLPDFRLASLVTDAALLVEAREAAFALARADPGLRQSGCPALRREVKALRARLEKLSP